MTIDYDRHLNPAQREAALAEDPAVLVIAGAGSGKTRTIVYRLAWLSEQGVPPEAILLLTFTRKASQEMLQRAAQLLDSETFPGAGLLGAVQGGTFHSFAYRALRRNPPPGYSQDFNIIDRADAEAAIRELKGTLRLGKGDRSFPKAGTIVEHISKARNKELSLQETVERDSAHLLAYLDDFMKLGKAYAAFRQQHNVMDYDDLLFRLEEQLRDDPALREAYGRRFRHIMVDEYQDTNLVQARLVKLLAPPQGAVMVVGDDAQSIYAFRGANVRNIMNFASEFANARIIKLERNYRSTQPVLDLANDVLAASPVHFRKALYTERQEGPRPELLRPVSDLTQARLVVEKVKTLLGEYPPSEIAVLFRAAYQSYHIETQLTRAGIPFRKYGGLKFSDAAHVKDVLAFVRLVQNPADVLAWDRAAALLHGVGQKTARKLHDAHLAGDRDCLEKYCGKWPQLKEMLALLQTLRRERHSPSSLLRSVVDFYQPFLQQAFPDDYPRRQRGLEELIQISLSYAAIDQLLADLCLETPEQREESGETITLTTIHQAKGLEWAAVLIIDLVKDRFPSRHALNSADDFEEERRLLYVACTRAKEYLGLLSPQALYSRAQEFAEPAEPSPFLKDLMAGRYEELKENRLGGLVRRNTPESDAGARREPFPCPMPAATERTEEVSFNQPPVPRPAPAPAPPRSPGELGYCRHKIFGRGKIIATVGPDKYRVNFPGFGPKVILAAFLERER